MTKENYSKLSSDDWSKERAEVEQAYAKAVEQLEEVLDKALAKAEKRLAPALEIHNLAAEASWNSFVAAREPYWQILQKARKNLKEEKC